MNVLLVDDDLFARNQIKTMFEWTKYGFQLEGEASNGQAAIQYLESGHYDIVITDMSMPVMNGVELIEYISKHWPSMKVIGLSSYSDFQYIRQSMKNGAIDYLLKHELNSESLLTVLRLAKERIEAERQVKGEQQLLSKQLSSNKEIMMLQAMQQILLGRIHDKEEIASVITTLQIPVSMKNFVLIVCQLDDMTVLHEKFSAEELERLYHSFLHICREIIKDVKGSNVFSMETGKLVILVSTGETTSYLYMHNLVSTALNRIRASVKQHINLTACYSVSDVCWHITDIHNHYVKADCALSSKFYLGKDQIIIKGSDITKPTLKAFQGIDLKTEKELAFLVQSMNVNDTTERIQQIFADIYASQLAIKSVQMACVDLIQIINKVAKGSGISTTDIFQEKNPYDILQKIETIGDLKIWILGSFHQLISVLNSRKIEENYSEYGRKAYTYIIKHYNEDISLQSASEWIGISSSYLSKVFKQDFGIGFSEYLNEYRVRQAQSLLQSGLGSLKDIVQQIGFNNYNYFFRVFKSITGMTPTEFEKEQKKEL